MRIQSEVEEKIILEKIVAISEEFLQSAGGELNYQKITDNILDISGAKYAGFNLYEVEGSKSITVAFSASEGTIKKISSLLGFKLVGKKWDHDPVRAEKIKDHTITHFSTLSEIAGDFIAKPAASLLGKTFNFGEVVIVKILKENVMLGDFTLIMPRNVKFKNDNYVEIYARQVGLLIARRRGEVKLIESKIKYEELFNSIGSCIAIYEATDNGNDFIFKDFNEAAEKVDKIKREDLIGKSVLKVFPGVKDFGLLDIFKRVYKTGKPENRPISIYKDSRISGWRENLVYKTAAGEIVAIYEDVTEKKQAEEEIKSLAKFPEENPNPRENRL